MEYRVLIMLFLLSPLYAAAQRVQIAEFPMSAINEKYRISLDTSNYTLYYKIGAHPAGTHNPVEITIPHTLINLFVNELNSALKQYKSLSRKADKGKLANDRLIGLNLGMDSQAIFARFSYTYYDMEFLSEPLFNNYYFNNKDGVNSLILMCTEEMNAHTGQHEGAILIFNSEREISFFISCFDKKLIQKYLDTLDKNKLEREQNAGI